jgi:hypothetical protein
MKEGRHVRIHHNYKKSLRIPKGYSEAVNRERADNTMTKIKRTKKKNNGAQNTTLKFYFAIVLKGVPYTTGR